MLKKNSMFFGLLLGTLVPVIGFALFYGIDVLIKILITNGRTVFVTSTLVVMGIFLNVLVFRYYMLKLEMDYTGRGILLATFVYALIYFLKFM